MKMILSIILGNGNNNNREISLVVILIQQLKEIGVMDNEIGVITPYNAQVQQLRKKLIGITKAEISTVDGFQVLFISI